MESWKKFETLQSWVSIWRHRRDPKVESMVFSSLLILPSPALVILLKWAWVKAWAFTCIFFQPWFLPRTAFFLQCAPFYNLQGSIRGRPYNPDCWLFLSSCTIDCLLDSTQATFESEIHPWSNKLSHKKKQEHMVLKPDSKMSLSCTCIFPGR